MQCGNGKEPFVSVWGSEDEKRWDEHVRAILEARYEIRLIHAYIEELCASLQRLKTSGHERYTYLKRHVAKDEIFLREEKSLANRELQRSRWRRWKLLGDEARKMYDCLVYYEAGQG